MMARVTICLLALISIVAVAAQPAWAQQAAAPAKQSDLEVVFTPYGWDAGLHGTSTVGDLTSDVDLSFSDRF